MSTYIPKELAGKMFDNRDDKRSKRSPDYTGTALINGQHFRVIGWYNPPSERTKKANINLKFQDKLEFDLEQQRRREARGGNLLRCPDCGEPGHGRGDMQCQYPSATPEQGGTPQEDFDDDIPF